MGADRIADELGRNWEKTREAFDRRLEDQWRVVKNMRWIIIFFVVLHAWHVLTCDHTTKSECETTAIVDAQTAFLAGYEAGKKSQFCTAVKP